MRRKTILLSIGIAVSLLWLVNSASWGVDLMAHGGNAAILRLLACKRQTPEDVAGCERRFKQDFDAEINRRWLLIGARTIGPIAAGWLFGWGAVALVSRTNHRQPPPPFT
jgi:hypothetical protein